MSVGLSEIVPDASAVAESVMVSELLEVHEEASVALDVSVRCHVFVADKVPSDFEFSGVAVSGKGTLLEIVGMRDTVMELVWLRDADLGAGVGLELAVWIADRVMDIVDV